MKLPALTLKRHPKQKAFYGQGARDWLSGLFYGPVFGFDFAQALKLTTFSRRGGSTIYDVAGEQRARLLRGEQAATRQLVNAYRSAEQAIQKELDQVLARMVAATAAGEPITPLWYFQSGRLEELLATVRLEIARFGKSAQKITTAQQAYNVIAATNAAGKLVNTAGVRSGFVLLHKEALTDLVGFMTDGSPLHAIFSQFGPDTTSSVRQVFSRAMALGQNPRVTGRFIKKEVGDVVAMSRDRAVLIARTETMRAYRTATLRNYQANQRIVKGWRWLSGRDWRCCPVCIAMDGSTHTLAEPFASHPGCRCSAVPVLSEDLDTNIGTGEEWLEEQPEEGQLRVMKGSKERLKLWQDGDVSLEDMVSLTNSAQWGPARTLKPLRELRH